MPPHPHPILTDKARVLRALEVAAVRGATGTRYLRMSQAAKILGVRSSTLQSWERTGRLQAVRWRVPLSPKAPQGVVVAYEIGSLLACVRRYRPAWSAAESERLAELLAEPGTSMTRVAAALGRSIHAVRLHAARMGVSRRNAAGWLTTGDLAALCGVTREAVSYWCLQAGHRLPFVRLGDGQREKLIDPADVAVYVQAHAPRTWARLTRDQRRRLEAMAMSFAELRRQAEGRAA